MTTTPTTPISNSVVELSPSYTIPLVLVGIAIALLLVQPWASLPIGLFGLFLMFQTVTLRLQFTETDLDVYRSGQLIRRFPYAEWQNWRIFWEPVPILFYFKDLTISICRSCEVFHSFTINNTKEKSFNSIYSHSNVMNVLK